MKLSRSILIAAALATLCGVAAAPSHVMVVTPQTARWLPVPGLKGAQMAIVSGDPKKAGGYYEYLLKLPAGTRVMPHFHRNNESVTVISGSFSYGVGDTWNASAMTPASAGASIEVPAGVHHYAYAHDETIVEISGIGPDVTTYVKK